MALTVSAPSTIRYPQATLDRAERAVRCAPFRLRFYRVMVQESVSLKSIAGQAGVQQGYTHRSLTDLRAEAELSWLLQVGLLRREVDGQGLTDRFRVTPLGRQLVDKWELLGKVELGVSWHDRVYNAMSRWFRLPF
jgi:DNA polymerase III epsilon subunit-like protein